MLVPHFARRLVQHFPSPLPRQVTDVGVFQVKRRQQLVESAEFEELPPVERAASASAVETRIQNSDFGIIAVAHPQAAVPPPALRQPRLFPPLPGIAQKNLARYGENLLVREPGKQRSQKTSIHPHVAVEKHDD